MTRRFAWSRLAPIGLSAAILIVIGCQGGQADRPSLGGADDSAQGSTSPPAPTEDSGRLLAHWPKSKRIGALIVSGQMNGYLEPCGCSAGQKGGLVRRATFIERLRREGWDLGLIDLGGLANDPAEALGGPLQSKLEFATSLEVLTKLGYDAIALAARDLRLSTSEVLMEFVNTLPAEPDATKILAANVKPIEGLGFEDRIRPSARIEIGSIRVGVTAVLDPQSFAEIPDATKAELLTVKPPEEDLAAVLDDLEKDTKLQVLMVQGPPELAKTLAAAYPGFEIVVGTSRVPDPPDAPEILNDGKTWLVTVGEKGMYLGVIGFYQDADQKLRYQRIELNERYDRDAELASEVRDLIDVDLQHDFASTHVLESYPRKPYVNVLFETPQDATFVGAETCKSCHAGTYAKWASTPHAHAYEVLVSDPHRPGRNRENDAACVSCHTTGFGYETGFVTADLTPGLKNNQCENCHGPGSAHAAAPDDASILKAISRTKEFFAENIDHGCIRCHDGDNDPHFDFATYWPKVMHNGLDNYDDPKVHQGVDPTDAQ